MCVTPGHVCQCFDGALSTYGYEVSDSKQCGKDCTGDTSQKCGNGTHVILINTYDAIDNGFWTEEAKSTVISVVIPMSGEITINMTNASYVSNDGKAYLTKMEITGEEWPELKIKHSQDTCDNSNSFRSNTFKFTIHNGTNYVDKLMAGCMILSNVTQLLAPLEVNLTFSPSHVLFPTKFVIQAEFENNICEYKDVGVVNYVTPDSNIDIWYPLSGSTTINHGGVLIHAYQQPFPSPRIKAYRDVWTHPYVSHIEIQTSASQIKLEAGSCGGVYENRSLIASSQANGFYYFNATLLVESEVFTCTDFVVLEIETDSISSYQSFIFQMYIMGCMYTTDQSGYVCGDVVDLTGATPGFPYDQIVIHSSSVDIAPAPVKPCDGTLYLPRASFAEPLIITVILLTDNRKESLPVNYVQVVGDVDSISIEYTQTYSSRAVAVWLPFAYITVIGDEFEAHIPPTDMYSVRIIDSSKGTHHNITDVIIKACILNEDIFNGHYVNDTRYCEETTTSTTSSTTTTATTTTTTTVTTTTIPPPTTTTTVTTTTTPPPTTTAATLASTTAMECCACTPVRPTISVQQAEEKAEQLAKELQVDKSTLSSTIRKKTSAKDERPSATMVGSIGAVLLSLTFGLVVILDADYIYKIYKIAQKWRRLQHKLKQEKDISNPEVELEPEQNIE
ncbi:uncharacterized protein LOC117342064 [Pecten maximus]|uniref:uncharacterized protein LOC117342064 n=1 Tax=Pecten maximus TaxID=6579 RepID=UPI0014589650|nr:uncharacterized protein LOC117342064 [Pecten maximus]